MSKKVKDIAVGDVLYIVDEKNFTFEKHTVNDVKDYTNGYQVMRIGFEDVPWCIHAQVKDYDKTDFISYDYYGHVFTDKDEVKAHINRMADEEISKTYDKIRNLEKYIDELNEKKGIKKTLKNIKEGDIMYITDKKNQTVTEHKVLDIRELFASHYIITFDTYEHGENDCWFSCAHITKNEHKFAFIYKEDAEKYIEHGKE